MLCADFLYPIVLCGMFNRRNMAERKRKPKFSKEELDILVTEVTRNEAMLFGRETMRLSHADRDKIWEGIARQITSVSQVPRSVKEIKHRWDDMKRRTKDKLAFMQRSLSSPGSTGRPSAIVLTAHERAIESTLHSSRQAHGFRRADLDVVDSPSVSCKYRCLNASFSYACLPGFDTRRAWCVLGDAGLPARPGLTALFGSNAACSARHGALRWVEGKRFPSSLSC